MVLQAASLNHEACGKLRTMHGNNDNVCSTPEPPVLHFNMQPGQASFLST
jgi:hypothetical protein